MGDRDVKILQLFSRLTPDQQRDFLDLTRLLAAANNTQVETPAERHQEDRSEREPDT